MTTEAPATPVDSAAESTTAVPQAKTGAAVGAAVDAEVDAEVEATAKAGPAGHAEDFACKFKKLLELSKREGLKVTISGSDDDEEDDDDDDS